MVDPREEKVFCECGKIETFPRDPMTYKIQTEDCPKCGKDDWRIYDTH